MPPDNGWTERWSTREADILHIYLLGQFRVVLDGQPIEIPERPAQSLFAYLALNAGAEHRREKLAGMLWPDSTEANARKYLRHALWRVRKSLKEAGADPDEFLQVSEISLAIKDGSSHWLDAHELLQADSSGRGLSESELTEAVKLYRGELLPGFFEDWTILERQQIRAHFQRLVELLLDRLLNQERWQEAQEWGERWIALGDVPEPAYRAVIVARAGAGDRSGSVAAYQRAVEDLKRELGLDPSPALRSTLEEVTQPTPRPLLRTDHLRDATGQLRGEIRPVTILSVDLVGLATPAVAGDLESFKEILDASMGVLVDEVLRYEGTVMRVQEDGLLACFGAPVAHEDDTRRTMMTALAIRDRFGDQTSAGIPVSSRIAVEAGDLLVGELGWDLRLGYTAVGRAVDVAARLRNEAEAGEILVGDTAYEEALSWFQFGLPREYEVEGVEDPVEARPLLSANPPDSAPTTEDHVAPMVGRADELANMLNMLDGLATRRGGAVFVVGEPGIGKSRLIEESRRQRSEVRWGQGRCVSYGANLPYHPFIEAIHGLLGLEQGQDPAQAERRVIEAFVRLPDDQRSRHERAIANLLGVPTADPPRPEATDLDGQSLAESVVALLKELGRDRPSVVALEDLHWADSATITLLREIMEDPEPLSALMVLSMRPVRETPVWLLREDVLASEAQGINEIHLERLTESSMSELLDAAAPLPHRVKNLLIRRSEGNPFFLGELHRTLVDEGVLVREDDRWVVTREVGQSDVPTTVQKSILARADRLPEKDHWVLHAASVLGWRFHASVLERVSEVDVGDALTTLARADFLRLNSLKPEPVYVFRHWLIRDAVYETLLRADRRRLHLAAGDALESFFGKHSGEQAGLLVYHYVLAGEPERALPYAAALAEMAWRATAPVEAAHAFQSALDQNPPAELALRLYIGLAHVLFTSADMDAGIDAYDQAIRLAGQMGDLSTMAECIAHSAMIRWLITEPRESRWAYLDTALQEIASAPDSDGTVLLHHEAARQHLVAGDVDSAGRELAVARSGLHACSEAGRPSIESHLLNTEGLLALREGEFEAGFGRLRRALQLAEESDTVVATARSRTNLATAMIDVFGHLEDGFAFIEETREAVAPRGDWAAFVEETVHVARSRWGAGRMSKGLAEIDLFAATLRRQPTWLPWNGAKAPLLAAIGHSEEALAAARDAWEGAQRTEDELAIRHAGLWMGRALGYAGESEEAQHFFQAAVTAAIGAPALRAEALAEWIYAARSSSHTAAIDDAVQRLNETPDLSPHVTAWRRIGRALASEDPRGVLESADYMEKIDQEYLAWLYRFRATKLMVVGDAAPLRESAESWAIERGLVLY